MAPNPLTVHPSSRIAAWVVAGLLSLCLGAYVARQCAKILSGQPPPTEVRESADWRVMPNIWACPWARDREVKFAFGYSWIDSSGFTYANGSKPEEEYLLHMDVRQLGDKPKKNLTPADAEFYSYDGLNCVFVEASVRKPRFGHGHCNELQIMLSYEGNQPLGMYTQTVNATPLPAWAPDPLLYVGAVEGTPVHGEISVMEEIQLSKHRQSWDNVLSTEEVTETAWQITPVKMRSSERPDDKLRPKDDDASAGVSAEDDHMSSKLYFVDLEFRISRETVHEVERRSVAGQLFALFGKVGGLVTLAGLVFNTIFVKAYPSSPVAKTYETRIPFWESAKEEDPFAEVPAVGVTCAE